MVRPSSSTTAGALYIIKIYIVQNIYNYNISNNFFFTGRSGSEAFQQHDVQVLRLLALLVQKYKY